MLNDVVQRCLSYGVKDPSSLCGFVDQQLMWPLVPVFSEQAERDAQLAYLLTCDILCERCNRGTTYHTCIRDCSISRI